MQNNICEDTCENVGYTGRCEKPGSSYTAKKRMISIIYRRQIILNILLHAQPFDFIPLVYDFSSIIKKPYPL